MKHGFNADGMTAEQERVFVQLQHLCPLEVLPDRDILTADGDNAEYGPYIVTVTGKVQSVAYHYSRYHQVNIDAGTR